MSKHSSATFMGQPRKSKWNEEVIVKASNPLICKECGRKRNRFLKGTLICALCATKLSERAQKAQQQSEVKKNV